MIDARALLGAVLLLACTEHDPAKPDDQAGDPAEQTPQAYVSVEQVVEAPARYRGRPLSVRGDVVSGSVVVNRDTEEHRFLLEGGGKQLQVVHEGVLPEFFREGSHVVVNGSLGPDHSLHARSIAVLQSIP